MSYGYMWWGWRQGIRHYAYAARGNYGQFIYLAPAKNSLIVRHGERFGVCGAQLTELFYKVASMVTSP